MFLGQFIYHSCKLTGVAVVVSPILLYSHYVCLCRHCDCSQKLFGIPKQYILNFSFGWQFHVFVYESQRNVLMYLLLPPPSKCCFHDCLIVCLLAGLCKYYWSDLPETRQKVFPSTGASCKAISRALTPEFGGSHKHQ